MHPKGPASKFLWTIKADVCWVPAENLICEMNPPEASTAGDFMFLKKLISRGYS